MKRKKITIIIILILIIAALLAYYLIFINPKKAIAKRCQGYVPSWVDFVDCYGVVVINDGWDMNYLSLKDHIHNYEIARVYSRDQYLLVNEEIFVINRKTIENSSSNSIKTTYYQKLFQNGQLIENAYGAISDIPTYLVVNTKSGETKAYKTINEIPQQEKNYFVELEQK